MSSFGFEYISLLMFLTPAFGHNGKVIRPCHCNNHAFATPAAATTLLQQLPGPLQRSCNAPAAGGATKLSSGASCDVLPGPLDAPVMLTGTFWLPFDVQFGSLFAPFPNTFTNMLLLHKTHPVYTRTHLFRIKALKIYNFRTHFWHPPETSFGAIYVAAVHERRILGSLLVSKRPQLATQRAPRMPICQHF